MLKHGMRIIVNGGGKRIVVSLGNAIELMIIRHMVSRKNPKRTDFLGFYISESGGLSKKTHGLLGRLHWQLFKFAQNVLLNYALSLISYNE